VGVEDGNRLSENAGLAADPADPDEALVAGVARGDVDAFAALYRRHQGLVYRFALHLTGSPATAEDVTHEAFLAVMREAGRFQAGRGSAAAWLCGIARNHARRRLDGDRRLLPLAPGESGGETGGSHGGDLVEDLARDEAIKRLRRAILALPLRYREAVVLCDLHELSYAEAAEAMECAIGTVRSRLHRARALLTERLQRAAERPTTTRPTITTLRGLA
jgi:RNA polymerase sigma-70 factor, ECF subfamily